MIQAARGSAEIKPNEDPALLALESNDIQLSNAFVISDGVQRAIKEPNDRDLIFALTSSLSA